MRSKVSSIVGFLFLLSLTIWSVSVIGDINNNEALESEAQATATAEVEAEKQVLDDMERLCLDVGFDALYVYSRINPPVYYCVELPAVGEPGLVIRIPDGVLSPDPTPEPRDESIGRGE